MKKLFLLALCVTLIAGFAFAGGGRQHGDLPFRAAFVTQAMSNPSQAFSWAEFQRLAPSHGFRMTMFAGENEPAVEVAGIEQAIAMGYDAIFINPSSIESIIPAITRAQQAGIIVAMFSSQLPPEHQHLMTFFVGSDDFLGGQQAGQYVSQRFPQGARVVEVGGQAGHAAQINRRDGFRAGMAQNITILDSQNPSGWNAPEAMAIMEDFIVRFGNQIDVVFCHWDNGATGVIQALNNAGMHGVFVIGVDGNMNGFAQVRDGTQGLSVGQNFTNMVNQSLANARGVLDGFTVPHINFIPLDIITADTIDRFQTPPW